MTGKLTAKEKVFRSELAAANINPDSFLATDYLNHFNEIVMLLEMALDMPDLMEEAASWKPASYVEHFEGSGFVDKELVIEAWGMTRPSVRACFEDVVEQLDELILSILNTLSEAARPDGAFDGFTRNIASVGQRKMQEHLSVLNGIIHDMPESPDGGWGDIEGDPGSEGSSSEAQSQDEIDQLFD